MKTSALFLLIPTSVLFAQYQVEPAGAPPADLPAAISATLQQSGSRVLDAAGKAVCEVWVRTSIPAGAKSAEASVAFPQIPQGALLGVIRFPLKGSDRRDQPIKAGVYTLRYSLYPVDGAHQGVAPQRDFLLLTPAAVDLDPAALPTYDQLVEMSRKASGTPHPAVLSIQTPLAESKVPGLEKEGEHDWVLNVRIGNTPAGIIVVGKAEG